MYAEHDGDVIRVEKELYGDVFRRPPKLTRSRHERSASRSSTSARPSQPRRTRLSSGCARSSRTRSGASTSSAHPRRRCVGRGGPRPGAERRRREADRRGDRVPEGGRRKPSLRRIEPYRSSASCPSGASTPGTGPSTVRARSVSIACARPPLRTSASSRATGSTRRTSRIHELRGFSTHRRSRAGSSSAVRGHSPTGQRQPRFRTRRRTGSSPRCSPTAGRPRFSSHSAYAMSWPSGPAGCSATWTECPARLTRHDSVTGPHRLDRGDHCSRRWRLPLSH